MPGKLEKPELKLKLELAVPDLDEGAPPKRFSVSRTLKARWSDDVEAVSTNILNEIKNYKGSFIGDTVLSLHALSKNDGAAIKEESSRKIDTAKYAASLIDSLIFAGIQDQLHLDLLEIQEIPEWDGTSRSIGPIKSEELKDVDIEKVMMLLAPKIKHALFLMSKDLKKSGSEP